MPAQSLQWLGYFFATLDSHRTRRAKWSDSRERRERSQRQRRVSSQRRDRRERRERQRRSQRQRQRQKSAYTKPGRPSADT